MKLKSPHERSAAGACRRANRELCSWAQRRIFVSVTLQQPDVGVAAPDFSLPDVYGKRWTWNQFRGKRVLLYMWASW